jgi:hypothetical protein
MTSEKHKQEIPARLKVAKSLRQSDEVVVVLKPLK